MVKINGTNVDDACRTLESWIIRHSRIRWSLCAPGGLSFHVSYLETRFATRTAADFAVWSIFGIQRAYYLFNSTTMSPPIGLALSKEHAIGKLIGQGAFGQVHAVTKGAKETEWACKLTAVPVKKTKKGDSVQEVAYMRLWSEYLLYSQHFRHLGGTILPRLPAASADGLTLYHDNLNGAFVRGLYVEIFVHRNDGSSVVPRSDRSSLWLF
jgi:hypothetical protein